MTSLWEKMGLIFAIPNSRSNSWMKSHASLPIPYLLDDKHDLFRIFFSTRDEQNRSHTAFFDIDLKNPKTLLRVADVPLLSPGMPASFDDRGVSLSCYNQASRAFYYLGWHCPPSVLFANQIGLAFLASDEKSFTKHHEGKAPVLGQCDKEKYSFGYPWVLQHQGRYLMWYDTNLLWNKHDPYQYQFFLRYADSIDGQNWNKGYFNCMELHAEERSLSRPSVIFEDSLFKMWYSINKKGKYNLGYAESFDGKKWIRKDDQVGIGPSIDGFDSEEVAYPYVFLHKDEKYMFYNGNKFGLTGIGLAKAKRKL